MGLPSIVTDINGSREIIEQGVNGVIVSPKDEAALRDAMIRMVEDTAATKRMAEAARPLIASRFERGFVQQCLFDFYDEISGE
jgi:glycosyltransferase involved in cell wall biosynthesis